MHPDDFGPLSLKEVHSRFFDSKTRSGAPAGARVRASQRRAAAPRRSQLAP